MARRRRSSVAKHPRTRRRQLKVPYMSDITEPAPTCTECTWTVADYHKLPVAWWALKYLNRVCGIHPNPPL